MSKLDFYPMMSPREIIEAGAFGGCYFGLEIEEYTNYDYQELFDYHFDGLDTSLYLGETYKPKLNKFKIRSGMNYEYWKEMKWMNEDDPYGWFEWYCKYIWVEGIQTTIGKLDDGKTFVDIMVDGEREYIVE